MQLAMEKLYALYTKKLTDWHKMFILVDGDYKLNIYCYIQTCKKAST